MKGTSGGGRPATQVIHLTNPSPVAQTDALLACMMRSRIRLGVSGPLQVLLGAGGGELLGALLLLVIDDADDLLVDGLHVLDELLARELLGVDLGLEPAVEDAHAGDLCHGLDRGFDLVPVTSSDAPQRNADLAGTRALCHVRQLVTP
jgi:hypothetical protein